MDQMRLAVQLPIYFLIIIGRYSRYSINSREYVPATHYKLKDRILGDCYLLIKCSDTN